MSKKRVFILALAATLALTVYTILYIQAAYDMASRLEIEARNTAATLAALLFTGRATLQLDLDTPREPIPVEVCVDRINGTVLVDGEPVARFYSNSSFCLRSGKVETVELRVEAYRGRTLSVLSRIITRGGLEVEVRGVAYVRPVILGFKLPLTAPIRFSERLSV